MDGAVEEVVLGRCQVAMPTWRGLTVEDFTFDAPKGFSSFTMGVRARAAVEPPAVLYRQLEGKENAILDAARERDVFLALGEAGIAARCLAYEADHRIEEFYAGRTLTAADVFDHRIQRGVAAELHRLHHLEPPDLPDGTFFELLHAKWGAQARDVLATVRAEFPADEQAMAVDLEALHRDETHEMVMRCLPTGDPVFCHNDTYHGNVFLLDDGQVRLLDFEFSCRNHIAFDFANFFAETVMVHGLAEPPHFDIAEPRFSAADIDRFVGFYLDNEYGEGLGGAARDAHQRRLGAETRRAILVSDYMYAMAALPLALEPIQRIRFIPYAHRRFMKFRSAFDAEFSL